MLCPGQGCSWTCHVAVVRPMLSARGPRQSREGTTRDFGPWLHLRSCVFREELHPLWAAEREQGEAWDPHAPQGVGPGQTAGTD